MKELTERQKQVAELCAQGLSNKEIGKAIEVSPETVRTHVRNIMEQTGLTTRVVFWKIGQRELLEKAFGSGFQAGFVGLDRQLSKISTVDALCRELKVGAKSC